jgi:hypothetical protein
MMRKAKKVELPSKERSAIVRTVSMVLEVLEAFEKEQKPLRVNELQALTSCNKREALEAVLDAMELHHLVRVKHPDIHQRIDEYELAAPSKAGSIMTDIYNSGYFNQRVAYEVGRKIGDFEYQLMNFMAQLRLKI